MKLAVKTRKLEKLLADPRAMERAHGTRVARALQRRIAVLMAAGTLADIPSVPPERCHQLTQDRDETFAVDLHGGKRLVFDIADDPVPRLADGGIDKKRVTAIRLVEVIDDH